MVGFWFLLLEIKEMSSNFTVFNSNMLLQFKQWINLVEGIVDGRLILPSYQFLAVIPPERQAANHTLLGNHHHINSCIKQTEFETTDGRHTFVC